MVQVPLHYYKSFQWKSALELLAHGKAVSALAVHEDLVITGGSDSLLKIWNIREINGFSK